MPAQQHIEQMVKKLERLPPERVAEVEDFIDFLHNRDEDRGLVQATQRISGQTLHTVWTNPADADYDRLSGHKQRPAAVVSNAAYQRN
ncbi:MAG: DUF2281 domain-containing protein [Rhodanobacteraceae bacterium]